MNRLNTSLKSIVTISAILTLLSGCAQTGFKGFNTSSAPQTSCTLPTSKKLSLAIQTAEHELGQRSCHYRFEAIHDQLLKIAQQDPAKEHAQAFLDFYKWSVDQGIIGSLQGKEYYTRYFSTGFGHVLPNDRNTCSLANNQDQLVRKLGQELSYKQIGLQAIMQDREAYFTAQHTYNDLVFLLQTTWLACQQG